MSIFRIPDIQGSILRRMIGHFADIFVFSLVRICRYIDTVIYTFKCCEVSRHIIFISISNNNHSNRAV